MKKIVLLSCVLTLVLATSLSVFAQEVSFNEADVLAVEQAKIDYKAGVRNPNGPEIYNLAMDAMKNYDEGRHHDGRHHSDKDNKDDPSTMEWILLGLLVASSISAVADHSQRQEACVKRCTEQTSNTYDDCLSICRSNPDAF